MGLARKINHFGCRAFRERQRKRGFNHRVSYDRVAQSFSLGNNFFGDKKSLRTKAEEALRAMSQRIAQDQDPAVQQKRLLGAEKKAKKVQKEEKESKERAMKGLREQGEGLEKIREGLKKLFQPTQ